MKLYILLFILVSFHSEWIRAQETYSYEQFINAMLKNDFGIQMVKNEVQITQNENNIGNAGYLPRISLDARQDLTINSARQEFLGGQTNEADNAQNRAFDTGVMLEWTFFDGFRMFATDKKLNELSNAAKIRLQAEIEMKVFEASITFYNYLALKELDETYLLAMELSRERMNYIATRKSKGAASEVEFLQSKLDISADSSLYLDNLKELEQLKTTLATYLNLEAEEINLGGELPKDSPFYSWEEILDKLRSQNTSLLATKSQIAIAEQEKKEAKGSFYPQLGIYANYHFNSAQNEVGFLLSNRVYGPSFGIMARWDIIDRLARFTELKNANLRLENAELQQKEEERWISSEAKQLFTDYKWTKEKLALEQANIETTEQIATIASESFRLGAISPFELREIQFGIVASQQRLIQAKLATINARLNLSLLMGEFK